jgi:membrane-bound serine protease (ClpP class)
MTGLGIALLLAGVILLVAEAQLGSAGPLGAIGTAAAVGGTVLAVDGAGGGLALALVLAAVVGLVAGGFVVIAARAVGRTSRSRVRSGREAMLGLHGEARTAIEPVGQVFVDGALWRARRTFEDERIEPGDPVVVDRIDGLTLTVRRAEPWELNP